MHLHQSGTTRGLCKMLCCSKGWQLIFESSKARSGGIFRDGLMRQVWGLLIQEVGYLHLEVQFCPFKSSGEAAETDPVKTKKPGERTMMRRMTRSNITSEHKGVLTVNVISAANLTVSCIACCLFPVHCP